MLGALLVYNVQYLHVAPGGTAYMYIQYISCVQYLAAGG